MREEWNDLVVVLRTGRVADVEMQKCPYCGAAQLSVAYTAGRRASLGVTCTKCLAGVQIDGVSTPPPWVSEVGNRVVTGKR